MVLSSFFSVALCLAAGPAPSYQLSGVVNAATGQPEVAPNTMVTIHGKDLAAETASLTAESARSGRLPITLADTGTTVFINGLPASIWMASPDQVNFVIPSQVNVSNRAKLVLVVNGLRGPEIIMRIVAEAPGLFQRDPETVLATHADGTPVNEDAPARPGEEVVLMATGLGRTNPELRYLEVAKTESPLVKRKDFRVLLNDQTIDDARIRYVGAAVGYAGTYQVIVTLPDDTPTNPELRVAVGEVVSQSGARLPVR